MAAIPAIAPLGVARAATLALLLPLASTSASHCLAWLLRVWLGAVLLAGTCAPAHAAPERWRGLSETVFRHYTAGEIEGANAVAQDASGFIWVATQAGLIRWDGYSWRRYAAEQGKPGALPDALVECLFVDARGVLWLGTNSGGLLRYDPEHDSFIPVGGGPDGLRSQHVAALAGDAAGGLWVGTGAGLDYVGPDGKVRHDTDSGAALGAVDSLLIERNGVQWAGTSRALLRRTSAASAWNTVPLPVPAGALLALRLHGDSIGRVWIGTAFHGVFVAAPGASAVREVLDSNGSGLQSDAVNSIAEVTPDEIWLATQTGGIMVVGDDGVAKRRIRRNMARPGSLTSDDIVYLFRERSGLMMVLTSLSLDVYDPQQRAVLSLPGPQEEAERAISVPSMLEMPDGRLWLGVADGGVDIYDPLLGRVARLSVDVRLGPGRLPPGRVLDMALGPDGAVYLGSKQGLYRSDPGGHGVERLDVAGRGANTTVTALKFVDGVLWLGGVDGLWQVQPGPGQRQTVRRHYATDMGDLRVTAIHSAQGAVWVGTQGGLLRVDLASGVLARVPTVAADPRRLPPGYVSSILTDRQGRLWVSTFGVGIELLEGRPDQPGGVAAYRWRRFSVRDGLPHNGVDKLLEDRQGRIWASTDNGLVYIDPNSFAMHVLQRPDEKGKLSFWTNAGRVTAAGELLFGGQSGLLVVRPDLLAAWDYRAPLVVSEVQIGNRAATALAAPASAASAALMLSASERSFWVEFAALDYSAPELNRYAYRLRGVDADWVSTEARYRRASYGNLAPGRYTLELRGSNREGAWSDPLELTVQVLPAWYQTWWLRSAAGLLTLLLMVGLVQGRTAYLRRRQQELQDQVDARTAELRAIQLQLEQLAYADPLTALPNRRMFNDDLRQLAALAQRNPGLGFTLLLVDLDHFKQVNDTLGHDAGDALLMEVARRLKLAVRESDRVARLGGDEFAVVLSNTSDRASVELVCERIVDSLAQPAQFKRDSMRVGASIGVVQCPQHGVAPDELYKAADLALYEAKRSGRHTWRWAVKSDLFQRGG